jgi:hypothetical protein
VRLPAGVTPLSDKHREHLRTSGLTDAIIAERQYVTVLGPTGLKALDGRFTPSQLKALNRGGIAYPQYALGVVNPADESEPWLAAHHWEVRPDEPRKNRGSGKAVKYERPTGVEQVPDVLPRYQPLLTDPSVTLWVTEGVKKGDALNQLELVAVTLPGVYGWRSRQNDAPVAYPPLHETVAWAKRKVVLAFDADRNTNRQVAEALKRLADLLARWGADVHELVLPVDGDTKVGVDDWLVSLGDLTDDERRAKLDAHTRPYISGSRLPDENIGKHPDTGKPLYNPSGYRGGYDTRLTYTDARGNPRDVCATHIGVDAVGINDDGDEMLVVRWRDGDRLKTVVAPRGDLARASGVLTHLAPAGAPVHDHNAKDIARYLIEFANRNRDALPRRMYTARYGLVGTDDDAGIIGPAWAIGAPSQRIGQPVRFTVRSGDTYRDALRAMGSWDGDPWPLRLVLGLSIASPLLALLNPRRNPVVGIGGSSNLGKGSAVSFAVGFWAAPDRFTLQGSRSRTTAILQTLRQLNGLPAWIDEAHELDARIVNDAVYSFANRQTYKRGGRDGTPDGGDELAGALFLTGEGLVEPTTLGARNRILFLPGDKHPPIGYPNSDLGAQRSALLYDAVSRAAGSVAQPVIRALWDARHDWVSDVHRTAEQYTDGTDDWRLAAAAAGVTLQRARRALELPDDPHAETLPALLLAALVDGWREVDPVADAFERLRDLVSTSPTDQHDDSIVVDRMRRAFARFTTYRSRNVYAVLANAPEVVELLKPYGGARVVVPAWQERGYLTLDPQRKSTVVVRLLPGRGASHRCYVFDASLFDNPDGDKPASSTDAGHITNTPN